MTSIVRLRFSTTAFQRSGSVRPLTLAHTLVIPVIGLYLYLVRGFDPPLTDPERISAWMLYAILGMILIGMVGVRLDPKGLSYVFMLGALLQTFSMFLMLIVGWRTPEAVIFVNVVLIVALLTVAWRFRAAALHAEG